MGIKQMGTVPYITLARPCLSQCLFEALVLERSMKVVSQEQVPEPARRSVTLFT